jgi:hypothetical protein
LAGALGAALTLLGGVGWAQERGGREPPRTPSRPATAPAAVAAAAADSGNGPEAQLGRAKLAYQRGDYGAAVLLLHPLLYPQALLAQEDQVLLAHKLLALSYFFEHNEAGAEQELNLLLSLRPDFALDPVVEPLKAVAFLDDIRRRNEQRLQDIRRRQAEEEQRVKAETEALQRQAELLAQKQARRVYIERVVYKKFSALSLLPLGVPQLAGGRRALGAVLLGGELLTAGASVGSWLTVRLRYPDNTFPPREFNAAQALTATYLTTGVVFWGLVLTGLIDALLHARTVTEVHELREPPKDLGKEPGAPAEVEPGTPGEPGPDKDGKDGKDGKAKDRAKGLGLPAARPHAYLLPFAGEPLSGEGALGGLRLQAVPSYGLQLGTTF